MMDYPYYNYVFFHPIKDIHDLSKETEYKIKDEFVQIFQEEKKIKIYTYSNLGLKTISSFMIWIQSNDLEDMQEFLVKVLKSDLGRYLKISYTLFGIKRKSVYGNKETAQSKEVENNQRLKYLIIYPFTKTSEWYMLPFEERRELMHEHIKTGYKYSHIKQFLIYSIGVDDNEFIVSYETASLEDFQSLVMEMRSTKVRKYTLNDIPIFTCIYKSLPEILEQI